MASDKITLKGVIDEDFVNYKKPSMTLMFPFCSFKCGKDLCHNASLIGEENIELSIDKLCERYIRNDITKAIVCQGLEPLDSQDELYEFVNTLRNKYECKDYVVIYTGYNIEQVEDFAKKLGSLGHIIFKFGGYIPGDDGYFNELLGVHLSSNNQYALEM